MSIAGTSETRLAAAAAARRSTFACRLSDQPVDLHVRIEIISFRETPNAFFARHVCRMISKTLGGSSFVDNTPYVIMPCPSSLASPSQSISDFRTRSPGMLAVRSPAQQPRI